MRVIRMILGEREVARVTENGFQDLLNNRHPFAPNFQNWYDESFYNIPGARTFEDRYALVKHGQYFCFSKPALKLVAEEID